MLYLISMATNWVEKRSFPRVALKNALRCQVRGNPEYLNAISEDISISGIGFINNSFIAPETCVNLELNILSRSINSIGKITQANPVPRTDKYRLGVQFLEMDPVQRRYLSDYVNMRLEDF